MDLISHIYFNFTLFFIDKKGTNIEIIQKNKEKKKIYIYIYIYIYIID